MMMVMMLIIMIMIMMMVMMIIRLGVVGDGLIHLLVLSEHLFPCLLHIILRIAMINHFENMIKCLVSCQVSSSIIMEIIMITYYDNNNQVPMTLITVRMMIRKMRIIRILTRKPGLGS